jgi:hypothetical protein
MIRRSTFASVRELITKMSTYIAHWNEDPTPFGWVATADEIISKVAILKRDYKNCWPTSAVKPIHLRDTSGLNTIFP